MKRYTFTLLALSIGLTGCAQQTVQNPGPTEADYHEIAGILGGADACAARGFITEEQKSKLKDETTQAVVMKGDNFDWQKTSQKELIAVQQMTPKANQADCTKFYDSQYTKVHGAYLVFKGRQEAVARQQAAATSAPVIQAPAYTPRNTYCNQIGTQTLCNSF